MLLTEDQLLSRIEVLENQLQLYCESYSGDDLRHQISELLDQKMQYELKSKESLRRVLQEKLEYASRLSEIQRNYDQSEEECEKLRIMYDESQKAAEQLAVALKTKEADMLALHGEMSGMKERLTTLEEQVE
jgi:superfamily II DNA/RNA helicase